MESVDNKALNELIELQLSRPNKPQMSEKDLDLLKRLREKGDFPWDTLEYIPDKVMYLFVDLNGPKSSHENSLRYRKAYDLDLKIKNRKAKIAKSEDDKVPALLAEIEKLEAELVSLIKGEVLQELPFERAVEKVQKSEKEEVGVEKPKPKQIRRLGTIAKKEPIVPEVQQVPEVQHECIESQLKLAEKQTELKRVTKDIEMCKNKLQVLMEDAEMTRDLAETSKQRRRLEKLSQQRLQLESTIDGFNNCDNCKKKINEELERIKKTTITLAPSFEFEKLNGEYKLKARPDNLLLFLLNYNSDLRAKYDEIIAKAQEEFKNNSEEERDRMVCERLSDWLNQLHDKYAGPALSGKQQRMTVKKTVETLTGRERPKKEVKQKEVKEEKVKKAELQKQEKQKVDEEREALIRRFLDEHLVKERGAVTYSDDAYKAYGKWCEKEGISSIMTVDKIQTWGKFITRIEYSSDYVTIKNNGRRFPGYKLR
jgi:hypothetical protein